MLSTSSAAPAHTNDMAKVTTMSGTRVRTTSAPLTTPRTSPRRMTSSTTRTAASSLLSPISVAAVTLVRAIIEATDRSMPPAMTTMAWPMATSAMGSAALASDSIPALP